MTKESEKILAGEGKEETRRRQLWVRRRGERGGVRKKRRGEEKKEGC